MPFANHVMLAHREETCILVGVSIQNLYGKGKKMHLSSIDCGKIFFFAWAATIVATPWHKAAWKTKSYPSGIGDDHAHQGAYVINW